MLHPIRFLIVIALVCLCTSTELPLPLFVLLVSPQAAESKSPWEEKEETSEEVVVGSSVRRRARTVGKTRLCKATNVASAPGETSFYARQFPAIVGHQLPNGLRAPLLI
ncbi:MAG: hypothetical protein ABGX22_04485 [Pirellulaceae bacterium]|jgi:hypothetical protein